MWIQLHFSTLATFKVELEGFQRKISEGTPHFFFGGHFSMGPSLFLGGKSKKHQIYGNFFEGFPDFLQ